MSLGSLKYWMDLHLSPLSEKPLKHRSQILMISVLMFFIGPDVQITLEKASFVGLGITVQPKQTFSIGLLLVLLLLYRVIAFWASVLIEGGTDEKSVGRIALLKEDPAWEVDPPNPGNKFEDVEAETKEKLFIWKMRQVMWEVFVPNILASAALINYAIRGYCLP